MANAAQKAGYIIGGVLLVGTSTATGVLYHTLYNQQSALHQSLVGPQGSAGQQGPQGSAGSQGPKGDIGPQGPAGKSPAIDSTVTGLQEYLKSNPNTAQALVNVLTPYFPEVAVPTTNFELNHSLPDTLYNKATAAAQSSLIAALKPQAEKNGITNINDIVNSATKLEFSDRENQVRIYKGPFGRDIVATIGYESEPAFNALVSTALLSKFDTVPFISGEDYATALRDEAISKKLGQSLVNTPIVDRKGNIFIRHTPEDYISFFIESIKKWGLAQVEFGRDGKIRFLYQGSEDRVPFQTANTDLGQQAKVMDALMAQR